MVKTGGKLLLVLIIGGIGGVLFERTLVPWLAQREPFSRIDSFNIERTTIVNPTEEIIINEAHALESASRAAYPKLVAVERVSSSGEVLDTASGVVLTSDGVVATTNEILGVSGSYRVHRERESHDAVFITENTDLGFALLRADTSGWPVVRFAETSDLLLGKQLFLLAGSKVETHESVVAELAEGAITKVEGEDGPEISESMLGEHPGAPVFTVDGRLFGLTSETSLVFAEDIRIFFDETDTSIPLVQEAQEN